MPYLLRSVYLRVCMYAKPSWSAHRKHLGYERFHSAKSTRYSTHTKIPTFWSSAQTGCVLAQNTCAVEIFSFCKSARHSTRATEIHISEIQLHLTLLLKALGLLGSTPVTMKAPSLTWNLIPTPPTHLYTCVWSNVLRKQMYARINLWNSLSVCVYIYIYIYIYIYVSRWLDALVCFVYARKHIFTGPHKSNSWGKYEIEGA
jgi:hypothetical protein